MSNPEDKNDGTQAIDPVMAEVLQNFQTYKEKVEREEKLKLAVGEITRFIDPQMIKVLQTYQAMEANKLTANGQAQIMALDVANVLQAKDILEVMQKMDRTGIEAMERALELTQGLNNISPEQAREFIRWQKILKPLPLKENEDSQIESSEIERLVENLSSENPDLDEADEWLESNRDKLTPENMTKIVCAAMSRGVTVWNKNRADKRHEKNREKDEKIPELWKVLKAKGISKNDAASRIAKEIGLKESTVREKLKGL